MKADSVIRDLETRGAFRIARPRLDGVRNVYLRLTEEGLSGFGEASPNAFYGEAAEMVQAKIAAASSWLAGLRIRSSEDIQLAWEEVWTHVAPSRAAQCAVDVALWDWLAQREGVTVSELAWGVAPQNVQSFCTIGLSTREELERKLVELARHPLIKIKSDQNADLHVVQEIRSRTQGRLAVDANCAWSDHDLLALAQRLAAIGIEFMEQPLPPEQNARLRRSSMPLPVFADESCVRFEDVEAVAEHFDGFNIKLVKCGGITPALRMVKRGRELGLKVMVGCMLESSVLIAAGAVIAQRTDYADLDGAWLIANDPFVGWDFDAGILQPGEGAGLGASPRQVDFFS